MDMQGVTLLTSTNWELWKTEVRVTLMHFGAWEFVNTSSAIVKPDDLKLTWKELNDIQLRKDRAYTLIYQSLSSEYRPLISETTDGRVAWTILKSHFEPTTRARVIQLLDEFFNTRYVQGENLGLFLCRVQRAAHRLREVGHELQPLYRGYQLIRSLPDEYRATVQAIYRWKDSDFTPEKIEAELLLEENRLNLSKRDFDVSAIAFSDEVLCKSKVSKPKYDKPKYDNSYRNVNEPKVSKPKYDNSCRNVNEPKVCSNSKPNKFKKIGPCFYCNSYGHLISNCKLKLNNVSKRAPRRGNNQHNNLIELSPELLSPELYEANTSDFGFDKSSWVFDTAATAHFCNNKNLFLTFEPVTNMQMSLAVGVKQSSVEGKGTIHFYVKKKNGNYNEIILKDVLYNPKLRRNLLSGVKLEKLGVNFVGSRGKVLVYDKNWYQLFFAKRYNDLYFLKPSKYKCRRNDSLVNVTANQAEKSNINELWHERFCHVNSEYLIATSRNNSANGIPDLSKLTEDCIPCKLAESKRESFKPIDKIRSKRALELLHMDLCGPLPVVSHGGSRYFLSIIDDY